MSAPKVLVLRPASAAERTAAALRAVGVEPVLAPLLTIQNLPTPIPHDVFDAVLATSANALTRLRQRVEISRLAGLPLVAVGDRTAAAGREAGFSVIHVADGDGRGLVAKVEQLFSEPGNFLHVAGVDRAFDVAGALSGSGHRVAVVELYKAEAADALPDAALRALGSGDLAAALQHSGRIATTFLTLADKAGLGDAARALPQVALSERIARPLRNAGCARIATAERPDEASLIDALVTLLSDGSPTGVAGTK